MKYYFLTALYLVFYFTSVAQDTNSKKSQNINIKQLNFKKSKQFKVKIDTFINKLIITLNNYSFEVIKIDSGYFNLGCTDDQGSICYENELPVQKRFVNSFYLAKFEVTQGLWQVIMNENPSYFNDPKMIHNAYSLELPIENISWYEGIEFIKKLNQITQLNFRYPTEVEWEYAARGGNKSGFQTKYSGSDNLDDNIGWYKGNSQLETFLIDRQHLAKLEVQRNPHSVGLKQPNALGIFDMTGNIMEWCEDYYLPYTTIQNSLMKPQLNNNYKVARGCSWNSNEFECRIAYRFFKKINKKDNETGLRLAMNSFELNLDRVKFDSINIKTLESDSIFKKVFFPLITKKLLVQTNPSAAEVHINGQFKGKTPLEIEFNIEKSTEIVIYKPQYNSKSLNLTIHYSTTNIPMIELENKKLNRSFVVNGYSFEMVKINGGNFIMGCTSEQGNDCETQEKPSHTIKVNSFYIGKFEVTQGLWKAVMTKNPSYYNASIVHNSTLTDSLPVENINWIDCKNFISKLNDITGKTFRLPTEAEWEFAARGGNIDSIQHKYAGGNSLKELGWFIENSDVDYKGYVENGRKLGPHPVGSKLPNSLGIFDMSGNVFEWCYDDFKNYPSSDKNVQIDDSQSPFKVLRGGSWYSNATDCRVSTRIYNEPKSKADVYGFRLAISK